MWNPPTLPYVLRSFNASGVAVTDSPPAADSAWLRARIVRDGRIFRVGLSAPEPSTLRVAGNAAALFVLVFFIGMAGMALGPSLLGYRPVVVGSGSMEPALMVADVVLVTDPQDRDVVVGNVVDIMTDEGGRIHRVVEVLPDGYRTKGDANRNADSVLVTPGEISGVGVFLIPLVGLPRVWFDNAEWIKLGSLALFFVVAAYCSRSDWLVHRRRLVAEPIPSGSGGVR